MSTEVKMSNLAAEAIKIAEEKCATMNIQPSPINKYLYLKDLLMKATPDMSVEKLILEYAMLKMLQAEMAEIKTRNPEL